LIPQPTYSGDTEFAGSSGGLSTPQVVVPTTSVTVSSTLSTSLYGQLATFSAVVTAGSGQFDNGGSVQFYANGVMIGSQQPQSGTASISDLALIPNSSVTDSHSTLLPGVYTITATYTGDSNFGGATGSVSGIEVVSHLLAAPTNFVVAGVTTNSIAFGWTDIDATATSYQVQKAIAGSANFTPLTGSPFGPGAHSSTATGLTSGTSYQFEIRAMSAAGVSDWLVSGDIETLVSTALSLSADPNPLQIWVTAANSVDQLNYVVFTAKVTDTSGTEAVPTGQVDFQDATTGTDLGTVPLSDGSASFDAPSFSLGDHIIVATYTPYPASIFAGSTNSLTEAVQRQPVTFTATVSNQLAEGNTPTGTVQFQVDGTSYGRSVTLDQNGKATISDASLKAGSHTIDANYMPTVDFSPSSGDTTNMVDLGDSWTGGAGDNNWDTSGNWTNGVPRSSEDAGIGNLPAGTVIKLGPADVANNINITSPLVLSGGQLTADGTLTDSAPLTLEGDAKLVALQLLLQGVSVMEGSQLSAPGTIQGNLVNDGEVDLGGSVGALVVTGNCVQGPNATLTVKINGAFAGDADQLMVSGTATLDGTLKEILGNGVTLLTGTTVPILDIVHPFVGGFSSVVGNVSGIQTLNDPGGGLSVEGSPASGPASVSVTSSNVPQWQPAGPSPIPNNGNTEVTPEISR
jgi:hypothetical protein